MKSGRPSKRAHGWLSAELRRQELGVRTVQPGPPAETSTDRGQTAFESGKVALAAGRLAEAYGYFAAARSFAGADEQRVADALAAQGRVRLAQENFGAAADAFREALHYNPAHVEARLGMAELALQSRRPDQAIDSLYEALSLIPTPDHRAALHLRLAGIYTRQRRPLLARVQLKAAAAHRRRSGGDMWNTFTIVARFLLTLPIWQLIAVPAVALLIAGALLQRGAAPHEVAGVALLGLITTLALAVWWAWLATPSAASASSPGVLGHSAAAAATSPHESHPPQ